MAAKEPSGDARRTPRFDVSLPVRFTEDGESFSDGVVTSISSIGMFVQTERVPALSGSVWFDLGFGGGIPPLRGRAKVGTLNRRFGTDLVTGFGIEFDAPRDDLGDALTRLEPQYPGAVKLDTQGALVWPMAPDPLRPEAGHEGDGVRLWHPGGWVGASHEEGSERPMLGASLGRPIADYLEMLQELNPEILAAEGDRVSFAYQGQLLCPPQGVPKTSLVEGLLALERIHDEQRAAARASEKARAPEPPPEALPVVEIAASLAPEMTGTWTVDLSGIDEESTDEIRTLELESLDPAAPPEPAAVAPEPLPPAQPPAPMPSEPPAPAVPMALDAKSLRGLATLDLLASQMRMVDDLSCGGWRLEHMWAEQLTSIGQACAVLEDAAKRLGESATKAIGTSADRDRDVLAEVVRGMEAVREFMARVLWNARAFTSSDEVFRAYDDWTRAEKEVKDAERAAGKDVGGKRKLFEPGSTGTTVTSPAARRVKAKVPVWQIVLAVVLVAAAGGAGYWSFNKSRTILESAHIHPTGELTPESMQAAFAAMDTRTPMAIEKIEAIGYAVRVTVPAKWGYMPKQRRQVEFETFVVAVADKGYTSAVAVTSEGIERASWSKGVLTVVD